MGHAHTCVGRQLVREPGDVGGRMRAAHGPLDVHAVGLLEVSSQLVGVRGPESGQAA